MDIYAKTGSKVTYTGKGGWLYERQHADEYLSVRSEYTVLYTEVDKFKSHVCLQEFPSKTFNSVLFD